MSSIVITGDGSHTIYNNELDEHYHSKHGAIAESMHVFIREGLNTINKKTISILEIGLGTGLNVYLTIKVLKSTRVKVKYTSIEKFPLSVDLVEKLNYPDFFPEDNADILMKIHTCPWNQPVSFYENFILTKRLGDIQNIQIEDRFDLVYYDAFGPEKQPELWTYDIFRKIYLALNSGGILTTYAVKGDVRRAMVSAGFSVEKLAGPPGKREMLRATRRL